MSNNIMLNVTSGVTSAVTSKSAPAAIPGMASSVYNDLLANAVAQGSVSPQLTIIEPIKRQQGIIKVAAYCRVSTDMEIQQSSLETQIEAYERIIKEHPGWTLSGIYADKGISGTLVRRRTEFLRMIQDAKDGKINYILAKSISRFSRNTVDALEYIRLLKNLGVSVYFEKEHLDTGETASELILSILAAAAQEEILTISTNLKIGRRMRAEAGLASWTPTYGYRLAKAQTGDKYADKAAEQWVICEEEARVVRRIFREFIDGWSTTEISKHLNDDGVPTARGYGKWASMTVSRILTSEKYLGDVLIMKYYVKDPIQHVRVRNKGVVKQYLIRDHHPAIIDRETAELARKVSALRDNHNGTTQYPFYGLLKCPFCGANMVRVPVYLENRFYAWTCGGNAPDTAAETAEGTERGCDNNSCNRTGFTRAERTECPPYAIWEESILKALCAAAEKAGKDISREASSDADREGTAKSRSRGRNNKVGSWKYAVINYRKLISAVDTITVPTWRELQITWADGTSSTAPLRWDQIRRPNPVTEGEEVPVSDETDAGNAEYNETAEEIPEETADEADDMKGETATEETADSTTDATTDNPNAATAEEGDSKEETEIPPSHAVYLAKAIDAIQNVIIEDGDPIPKVYGVGSKRFKERQDGHNGNAQADMDQAC